mmetsp:Transcript_8484/g.13871  ORF Transcript_8484/g.13871 Transcript_8484/m.13871 type:complete len:363 (-) Transcript_8484:569-1657(-)
MGDLFYADFGLRFVISDPSWLADVFKAIITYQKRKRLFGHYSENGFVDSNRLEQDLAQANLSLEPAEFNMIVVLLNEAEFAFPRSLEDGKNLESLKSIANASKDKLISLVVPTLAHMDPPSSFKEKIETLRKGNGMFSRRFVFNFISGGFVHRFLFRSLFRSKIDALWQRGALLRYPSGGNQGKRPGGDEGQEYTVLLEMQESALALSLVIDSAEPLPGLYSDFLQMMDGLLSSEFQGVKWHVECPCACHQGKSHFVRVDINCEKLAFPPSDLGLLIPLSSDGVSRDLVGSAQIRMEIQTSAANATLKGLVRNVLRDELAGLSRKVSLGIDGLSRQVSLRSDGCNSREVHRGLDIISQRYGR